MELNKELYIKGVSDYLENGLNLFDGTWESGSINNSGADTSSTTSIRSNYVSIAPNTSYYFSSITSSEVSELWANYYSNGVFVSREYLGVTNSKNFTTPAGVNQVRFRITFSSTVTANVISNVMLNKGSIQLPYEEYYEKYLNKGDIINGILSNNQMWRFKSFSLSGATSYDLTFDSIEDLGQFSIVIINTITSSNSSTKIGFCRNFSTYSYSNIFQDHTGTDVITNVSRTAGNVLRITTSTTSSIVVGVTYMRIFRRGLNYM